MNEILIPTFAFQAYILYTLNKKGILLNPPKRFRKCKKAFKNVKKLKKRLKRSTEPKKVLPVYPGEEPHSAKLLFKFRTTKKGFVGKYETFKVLY